MIAVTSAASPECRPSRTAIRSANDPALYSRTSCTIRRRNFKANRYIKIAPTKVGGSHQPERLAWVTVPKKVHEVQWIASDNAYTIAQRFSKICGRRSPRSATPKSRPSQHNAASAMTLVLSMAGISRPACTPQSSANPNTPVGARSRAMLLLRLLRVPRASPASGLLHGYARRLWCVGDGGTRASVRGRQPQSSHRIHQPAQLHALACVVVGARITPPVPACLWIQRREACASLRI